MFGLFDHSQMMKIANPRGNCSTTENDNGKTRIALAHRRSESENAGCPTAPDAAGLMTVEVTGYRRHADIGLSPGQRLE